MTADTYRLAQGLVMVDSLGRRSVKGMSPDVSVFALRGVRSGRTRNCVYLSTLQRTIVELTAHEVFLISWRT